MSKEMEEKNKYQEALDNAVHDIDYKYYDFGCNVPEERFKEIDLLQELVDKETPKDINLTYGEIQSNILYYYCPNCCSKVKDKSKYCSNCGQKIKW